MRRGRDRLLIAYLETVTDILNRLQSGGGSQLSPPIAFLILLLLVASTAYTSPLPLRFTSILPITVAIVLSALSHRLRELLKMMLVAALFLATISAPLIFLKKGTPIAFMELNSYRIVVTDEGFIEAFRFFFRCMNTISISLGWICYVHFNSLLEGFTVLDPSRTIPTLLFLSSRYIPISIRDAVTLLAAREARTMRRDRRLSWTMLSSTCGELLIRAIHRARRVGLAISARTLSNSLTFSRVRRRLFTPCDLAAVLMAALYVTIYTLKVV